MADILDHILLRSGADRLDVAPGTLPQREVVRHTVSISPDHGAPYEITLETGSIALQCDASVVARSGDTVVLCTVMLSTTPQAADFLPLTVNFRERYYSHGAIPQTRERRELRPTRTEVLFARCLDRGLRPLFPSTFRNAVVAEALVLSTADGDAAADPVVLAQAGLSAALLIARLPGGVKVPLAGPVCGARVNSPYTFPAIGTCTCPPRNFECYVAGVTPPRSLPGARGITNLEVNAENVPSSVVTAAVLAAFTSVIEPTIAGVRLFVRLVEDSTGRGNKATPSLWRSVIESELAAVVNALVPAGASDDCLVGAPAAAPAPAATAGAENEKENAAAQQDRDANHSSRIQQACRTAVVAPTKPQRAAAKDLLYEEVERYLSPRRSSQADGSHRGRSSSALSTGLVVDALLKRVFRQSVVQDGLRVGGRALRAVREMEASIDVLPAAHGSALFSRGETQVLATVTLGSVADAAPVEEFGEKSVEPFMVHYNFPAFSTGEVKKTFDYPGRREIGHGYLIRTGLESVIPTLPSSDSSEASPSHAKQPCTAQHTRPSCGTVEKQIKSSGSVGEMLYALVDAGGQDDMVAALAGGKTNGSSESSSPCGSANKIAEDGTMFPSAAFPYSVRVVAEVLGSNGSSSMTSTSATAVALMAAGVPLRGIIAGATVGAVWKSPTGDGAAPTILLLPDINGEEDGMGCLDFKVSGTISGVAAVQADIKEHPFPLDRLQEAFDMAQAARVRAIETICGTISAPRSKISALAPHIRNVSINAEYRSAVIGKGGVTITKIERSSRCRVRMLDAPDPANTDNAIVEISGPDVASVDAAEKLVMAYASRPADAKCSQKFSLPKSFIPILIGKGGETVKALEGELKVLIKVDRTTNDAVVSANTDAAVAAAVERIKQLQAGSQAAAAKSITVVRQIPQLEDSRLRARVIGVGGRTIRNIQEETNTLVDVGRDGAISVTGDSKDAINTAFTRICAIACVEDAPEAQTSTKRRPRRDRKEPSTQPAAEGAEVVGAKKTRRARPRRRKGSSTQPSASASTSAPTA